MKSLSIHCESASAFTSNPHAATFCLYLGDNCKTFFLVPYLREVLSQSFALACPQTQEKISYIKKAN